jgi:hypothetical protein
MGRRRQSTLHDGGLAFTLEQAAVSVVRLICTEMTVLTPDDPAMDGKICLSRRVNPCRRQLSIPVSCDVSRII